MNKKNIIIISILSVIIISLVGYIIYLNYWNKVYKKRLEAMPNVDDEFREIVYDCSFTKTYRVDNLWKIDAREEIPGMAYVILTQFQNDDKVTAIVPTEIRDKLQENKYYEFTYIINGKDRKVETMEDINNYFKSDYNNPDFKITISVKETDKQGLEQIQENICLPK